jgi:hypothetical protein
LLGQSGEFAVGYILPITIAAITIVAIAVLILLFRFAFHWFERRYGNWNR